MKCQNCSSSDIVAIQGQNYCINCGQLVKPPVAVKQPPKDKKPASKPVASAAPGHKPAGRVLNLRPVPENNAHPERIKPHPWRFTLLLSGSVAIPVGLAVWASLGFRLDRDITLYLLLTALLVTSVSLVLSQSALMYGLSKNQDGRVSSRSQWWAAARSGFMDLLNLDLMSIILALLTGAAGFAGFQVASASLSEPVWLGPAVLLLMNALLIWILMGVFTARRMAIPAVVIGGLPAGAAFAAGWRAYLRFGGRLLVAGVETILIRISAVLLAAALVLALFKVGQGWDQFTVAAVAGAAAAVIILMLFIVALQVELKLWLALYRFWMPASQPANRAQLLGGRRAVRRKP